MAKQFYKIKAAQNDTTEIFIYSMIGESWWGDSVSAKQFVKDIADIKTSNITVRINSRGGSVVDGIAIYNALRRHDATITTINDGIAASISSLILMAGDTVEMAENAQIMIHAPWTYVDGNSAVLRDVADMLDGWADAMSVSYSRKSGKSKEDILQLLTDGKDHFYTAEEALAEGFIDSITEGLAIAAADRSEISMSIRDFIKPVAAATKNKEPIMPQATTPAAEQTVTTVQAAQTVDTAAIEAAAVARDQARRNDIAASFAKFTAVDGVAALLTECQNDTKCTVQAANDKLLAKLGEGSVPVAGSYVVTVEDARDKIHAGMTQSLLARCGLEKHDTQNQFRGYTLTELARASLESVGFKVVGLDKMQMVAAAFTHSTSDFPNILSNVANKAMMKGFEEAQETFQLFTSVGNLTDFKPTSRVDVNAFPSLDKVAEGAEYKYGTVGDRGETIVLATYGKLMSITRQAIINDDLDAITKILRSMGRAAIRTVGDLVYAILTSNPKMGDGTVLFHANHANLLTGAAISTDSVDAMRVAMGKQKLGGVTTNARLRNLIVPLALEGVAQTVKSSQYKVGGTASTSTQTVPNTVANTFEVIADARLDAASSSNWYGAADPNVNDVIEVAYLDGNQTPTLEQQGGWNIDGVELKVRLDAGVKALSWVGLAKNPN